MPRRHRGSYTGSSSGGPDRPAGRSARTRHPVDRSHILGTLDNKIELNRRTNETLEAMARALFKSWFVDFEPSPGQDLEGRWRPGESLPGLPADLYDLFPDRFVPSELGGNPRGLGREGPGGGSGTESQRTNEAGDLGSVPRSWLPCQPLCSSPENAELRGFKYWYTLPQRRYAARTDNSVFGERQDGLCPIASDRYGGYGGRRSS